MEFKLPINKLICVCGHCGHHDNQDALIELNFREQRVIYLCSNCKKDNSMSFGKEQPAPYPKSSVSRV